MRVRATPKGLAVRLDGDETREEVAETFNALPELPIEIEINGRVSGDTVAALIQAASPRPVSFRPPRGERWVPTTEVVVQTLRAGRRVEVTGTLVVLGDVNPGAEVIAGGDVIVVGKLRGLAHAGAGGNTEAMVWALALEAKQLRIADLVARAPEEGFGGGGPERALIRDGRIVIEPWKPGGFPKKSR